MHSTQNDFPADPTGPSTVSDTIRVLYVEDNSNFAALAQRYLEAEPGEFDIEHVTHPAAALARLTDEIDCLVSGYRMPAMTGIELLKTVRESRPTLPFILFTARRWEVVDRKAISAGVIDYEYLQKRSGTAHFTALANRVTNAVDH